jgi:hypothetical protein
VSETSIVKQKARIGSDEAFHQLAERYRSKILLRCYGMLGSETRRMPLRKRC